MIASMATLAGFPALTMASYWMDRHVESVLRNVDADAWCYRCAVTPGCPFRPLGKRGVVKLQVWGASRLAETSGCGN
jgi:hypothetical protein